MEADFGSVSRKLIEPDWLGRPRRVLTIESLVGDFPGAGGPLRFDAEDVDHLAVTGTLAMLRGMAGDAPVELLRRWAPWAVVYQAIPEDCAIHRHSDAVCTIANAPASRSILSKLFDGSVTWLPYVTPGPLLADALVAHTGNWAVVQHLGIFGWGGGLEELQAQAETIETTARDWLNRRIGTHGLDDPASSTPEAVALISTIRGLLSNPRRVVLSIDATMRSIAGRRDIERVIQEAQQAELPWPWAARTVVVRDAVGAGVALEPHLSASQSPNPSPGEPEPVPRDTLSANIVVVPGIGLVSAASNQAEAEGLSVVAAHVHRVAAANIDLSAVTEAVLDTEVKAFIAPIPPTGDLAEFPFAGRVYIVTGAASGIGRDIARHLGSLGASLGLADINGEALMETANELFHQGCRPVTVVGDLTDELIAELLVETTVWAFGGIDGVVFNAGVAMPGDIKNLSALDWRRSLEVNATSSFLLAKRVLPVLENQGIGGSLVFIGSKNMFSPGAGFGAYSASKGALAQLARVVAMEGGPSGVRSNIVNPDNVFEGSNLWSPELRAQRAAVYHIAPEELENYYTQRNLMKVPITGADVAKAVAFLLSDDSIRTTACVLTVDGGVPGVFPR